MSMAPESRKPHYQPRYDCPPGNVYVAVDRGRYVITYAPRQLRLAIAAAPAVQRTMDLNGFGLESRRHRKGPAGAGPVSWCG